MVSEQLLRRFLNLRWAGDLPSPTAVAVAGNPTCGDVVQIGLEVAEGEIRGARFRTLGCAVAIAASDAMCELLIGRTLTAAEVLDSEELAHVLGGIPGERESCAAAPLGALRSALQQIRSQKA